MRRQLLKLMLMIALCFFIQIKAQCAPKCEKGSYQVDNVGGTSICEACGTGRYQPYCGKTFCYVCQRGKFANQEGSTSCRNCAKGTYQPDYGQSRCLECKPGWFNNQQARPSCRTCYPGQYTDEYGQTICKKCPAGQYQSQYGKDSCLPCNPGFYSPTTGRSSCISCQGGKYEDRDGSTACKLCDAGKYQNVRGKTECKACSVGYFQPSTGRTSCSECPNGHYGDEEGLLYCKRCPIGHYINQRRAVACRECEPGKYQPATGQRYCSQCPKGKYQDQSAQDRCLDCPSGKYTDVVESTACKDFKTCPRGTRINYSGSAFKDKTCSACPKNYFSNIEDSTVCYPCGPGFYTDAPGQAGCKSTFASCPEGTYRVDDGTSVTCITCDAGFFTDAPNQFSCIAHSVCSPGYREIQSPTTKRDRICELCPSGSYTSVDNSLSCTPCDGITGYQPSPGSSSCLTIKSCPIGTKISVGATATSDRVCEPCILDETYQPFENQPSCLNISDCAMGEFQSKRATTSTDRECSRCNGITQYQDEAGQITCKTVSPCGIGKGFLANPTPTSDRVCETCGPDTFSDVIDDSTCKPVSQCGIGLGLAENSTESSDVTCRACGFNLFKNFVGNTECTQARSCNSTYEMEVVLPSTSTDRKCNGISRCLNGTSIESGQSCQCPSGEACNLCISGDFPGFLLFRENGLPVADPVSVESTFQLDNTLTAYGLLVHCSNKCNENDECTAFHYYKSGSSRGICVLMKYYEANSQVQKTIGADFMVRQSCSECRDGFVLVDGECQPTALPPKIDPVPNRITVAIQTSPSTQLIDVDATPDPGAGPVYFSLQNPSSYLNIDESSGIITLAEPLQFAELISVTVVVSDSRPSCSNVVNGKVRTKLGGCQASVTLKFAFTELIGCSTDQNVYLTSGNSADLDIPIPTVPSFVSNLVVHTSLGSLQSTQTFGLGKTEVTFYTDALDVGGAVSCSFVVNVLAGFKMIAEDIGHLPSSVQPLDFILDGNQISGGGLKPPYFTGQLLGRKFGFGVDTLATKRFNLRLLSGYTSEMFIALSWCSQGILNGRESDLIPVNVTVDLLGTNNNVSFVDEGSGIFIDGTCFSIKKRSSPIFNDFAFSSISINIDSTSLTGQRRRNSGSALNYQPVGVNAIAFQHTPGSDSVLNPGSMLVIADLDPPQWIGCPSTVFASASYGQDEVAVTWDEPTAIDDIQITEIIKSATPNSLFSILGSPHEVTYTASDGVQSTDCIFQVQVDFPALALELQTITPAIEFEQSFDALFGLQKVSYGLIDPFEAGLTFTTTFENITSISMTIEVAAGDVMLARPSDDVILAQLAFDITWVGELTNISSLSNVDDDIKVHVAFTGFSASADSDLKETIVLDQANVAIDSEEGIVELSAYSPVFHHDITFTAITLTLDFPSGRPSAPEQQFAPLFSSQVSMIYFFDQVDAPTDDELHDFPLLIPVDLVDPTLRACPMSMNVTAPPGMSGSIVNWTEPIATDNRGEPRLTSNFEPGMFHAIQDPNAELTNVTYIARDTFGNSVSCSFTIQIQDIEIPDLECQGLQSFNLSIGQSSVMIPSEFWMPVVMRDNSNLTVTIMEPQGILEYDYGPHTIIVKVKDAWSNEASCESDIFVHDNEAPYVQCPTLNPVSGEEDSLTQVFWSDPVAYDNDEIVSVSSDYVSGASFPFGLTNVTVTATDRAGNQASCLFLVDVRSPQSSSGVQASVIGGAAAGAGILIILCIYLFVVFIQARNKYKKPQKWEDIFAMIDQLQNKEGGIREPRELQRSSLTILDELGMGAFGVVYKGLLKEGAGPGYLVAVKSLHAKASSGDRTELLEEAAIMAQFQHPHVVQLVGVVTVGKPLLVVIEFMEYGNLKSYLEKNDVTLVEQLKFASDCASGLNYIHESCFVHRDVAARNVLISSDRRCKISDFGLARDTAEDTYYRSRGGQLPVRWSAPEALEERKFNEPTDVWSYGILLYEIWTKAALPYDGMNNAKVWVQVSSGYRLPQPDDCPSDIYNKMRQCWDVEPACRPNFEQLELFFKNRYAEESGESIDGYLDVNDEEEETSRPKSSSKLGSFFRRLSSRGKSKKSRGSDDKGSIVVNPVYDENISQDNDNGFESVPGQALYDFAEDEAMMMAKQELEARQHHDIIEEEEEFDPSFEGFTDTSQQQDDADIFGFEQDDLYNNFDVNGLAWAPPDENEEEEFGGEGF